MKNLYLSIFILSALIMNVQETKATTYTFTSFAAANWTNTSKWTPNYPGNSISVGDEVIVFGICFANINISIGGDLTVHTLLRVNSGDTLTIQNNGTYNNEESLSIDGILELGGTLSNNGTVNLNSGGELVLNKNPASLPEGTFNWNNGGTLSIGANGRLVLPNALTVESGRTLKVNGILRSFEYSLTVGTSGELIVNGDLTLHNSATVVNNSNGSIILNGLLKFQDNSTLTNNGIIDLNSEGELFYNAGSSTMPGAVFNWNSGTVRIGSNGILDVTGSYTIPSDGTFRIVGTMQLNGTITNNGDWILNDGAYLILNNSSATWPSGNFIWETGSTMTVGSNGVLTVTNTNKTIEDGRTLQVDGTFNMALTNNNPRQLNVIGILINNGTVTHKNGYNVNVSGTLNNDNVFIVKNGTGVSKLVIENQGVINNTGTLTNNRTFSIFPGGTFNNHGAFIMKNNGILDNSGVAYLKPEGEWNLNTNPAEWPDGNFVWEAGSTMIIGEDGNLELTSSKTIEVGNTLQVEGTLEIAGPLFLNSTLTNNGTIENNGTITITSSDKLINHGTLTLNGTLQNNGTFTDNGLLNGNGNISSSSIYRNLFGGLIAPGPNYLGPGCLNIDKDFINLGTLDIDLADGNNCVDFDRIVVTGNAIINGTININFIDNIEPINNTFTILTAVDAITVDSDISINWPTDYEGTFSICSSCSPKELVVTFINSPLPVKLVYFRAASIAENKVSLDWQTASEENNKGFEIQRSFNSRDWETIGFLDGKGTTTNLLTYNFEDEFPNNGNNYYRLKQKDFDGAFEYSDIRTVAINQIADKISVYPNPTSDKLHINIDNLSDNFKQNTSSRVQLFNSLGKLLLENNQPINDLPSILYLTNYPKGNYTLVITLNQEVFTKQIIVQ